jgi:hypothetical protein
MLNASNEYMLAARGGGLGKDAVTPITRTILYREYNSILDPTVTAAVGVDTRFNSSNVLKTRNPLFRGISYGTMDEFFLSDDPSNAFRFIQSEDYDEERDAAYYIPVDVSVPELADVTIDYGELVDVNNLQVRYDNTKSKTEIYDYDIEIYGGSTLGSMTLLFSQEAASLGVTDIFYNGSDWNEGPSRVDGSMLSLRYIQLIVRKGADNVNPRIMYFGALQAEYLDDDIVSLSINKSEFEQSTYLPYGESSSNYLTMTLDNTGQKYRYGPSIKEEYLDKFQKITVEFGFDVSKYGGSGVEYVAGGTYYIDDFNYSEGDMTMSVNATDYSIFLKEEMCSNSVFINKSLKYIIKEVLAQAGFAPRFCVFNFGIVGNSEETNIRKVVWTTSEQSVWDFLSTLIKSEMGNMYIRESGDLVFTDRAYFRTNIDNGVTEILTDAVDIIVMNETKTIGANKITVKYNDIGPSKDDFNPARVVGVDGNLTYINQGPRYKNNILWSPSDETFLGSTVLSRQLNADSTHIYVPIDDANQISEDEGIVRIGREFIRYEERTTTESSGLRLKIVERGAFNSAVNGVIPPYNVGPPRRTDSVRNMSRPDTTTYEVLNRSERRGLRARKLHKSSNGVGKFMRWFVRPDENKFLDYDVYGLGFTFNEITAEEGFIRDQRAGMVINVTSTDYERPLYFSVSKDGLLDDGKAGPNLVAFKGGMDMASSVLMPPFPEEYTDESNGRFAFAETKIDESTGLVKLGTPVQILVYHDRSLNVYYWYVNGSLVNSFSDSYSHRLPAVFRNMTPAQNTTVAKSSVRGAFGFFLQGSSDVTVDYMFATNNEEFDANSIITHYNSNPGSYVYQTALPDEFVGYYEEFGATVHEVSDFKADHSVYPNLNPRILNTLEDKLAIYYQTHTPFTSRILVSNNDRYGVSLNGTNFTADGGSETGGFLVYGVPIVTEEEDQLESVDSNSVRKYGPMEVEIANEWVDSQGLAKSLADSILASWKKPVSFFNVEVFPLPTIQPGDRIAIDYPSKGFTQSDVWIVTGVTISYDGGLSGTLNLKRFIETPPVP